MEFIKVLKERLINNTLMVQQENGYYAKVGFHWNKPATIEEINAYEEQNGIRLPMEYKDFLLISNGAVLFKDINYGQWGCNILPYQDTINVTNQLRIDGFEIKKQWLVFSTWLGDMDHLFFDLENINTNKYIIDVELDSIEEWEYINGSFETWLDRLIVSQGCKYWKWNWWN